jgi:hypothetical protein
MFRNVQICSRQKKNAKRSRRTPGFAQELRHLHNLLAIPSKRSQPLVPSRAACLPRRRPIDVGDPDLNDFINRSIGRR